MSSLTTRVTPRRVAAAHALPGLDGLRALAVAAVLTYHLQAPWLPGGFVGVDVFLVLSGYLITTLLLEEVAATGRVSLREFWRRRARRLLPALVLVVAVTLAAMALSGRGGALRPAATDGLAGVLGVANWHDVLAGHPYAQAFGAPRPFAHLWSLAVEAQFYAVWPLVLLAALRLGGRRLAAVTAAVLAVLSVAAAFGLDDVARVYAGTDTRAVALLLGALLALAPAPGTRTARRAPGSAQLSSRTGRSAGGAGRGALGLFALGGLAVYAAGVHDTDALLAGPAPALAALLAVPVVAAAATPATMLARALSLTPLRWIGERSYGIYLWHWPVVALTRPAEQGFGTPALLTAVQVALTVALAAACHRLLETPVRRHGFRGALRIVRWRVRRRPVPVLAGAAASGGAAAAAVAWLLLTPAATPAVATTAAPTTALTATPTAVATAAATATPRARKARSAVPTGPVLVVGDSVVQSATRALDRTIGGDRGFACRPSQARDCGEVTVDGGVARAPATIVDRVAQLRGAGRLPARLVVHLGDNGPVDPADLERLRRVTAGVRRIVLVTPRVPRWWGDGAAAAVRAAAADWPGARVADWEAVSNDRDDVFVDGVHPTARGSALFARLIARALGAP